MTPRFVLDPTVRRAVGGRVLLGGSPGRMIRLSQDGAQLLDALLSGESVGPAGEALSERLTDAGLIHPTGAGGAPAAPALTTVIPVRDGGVGLAGLIRVLSPAGEVLVVDDGSSDGTGACAAAAGARVVTNAGRPGPAGARNTGLRAATTEFVAFIDADCRPDDGWPAASAALLAAHERTAAVAPRIRGAAGASALARYETSHSPLDLGGEPGLVGMRRRLAFVPSTALVVRRTALLELGGFDENLRFGEDVDLSLRLDDAGWRIRYAPQTVVEHSPRGSLAAFARQRFDYAGSAVAIDDRNPGRVAPVQIDRQVALVWGATAIAGLRGARPACLVAALGVTATVLRAVTQVDRADVRPAMAVRVVRGHATSLIYVSRALARDWLPASLLGALVWKRSRPVLAIALAIDLAASRRRDGQRLALPLRLGLHLLSNAAYAAGIWTACASRLRFRAIRPARIPARRPR